MGQPQCFRRQILREQKKPSPDHQSYLLCRAAWRFYLRLCDSDFETVFRAVGPRAPVRLDGDDIWSELRSVSIVALEEAVGCVRDGSSGCNSIPSSLPTVPVTYCGGSKVFCIIMSMPSRRAKGLPVSSCWTNLALRRCVAAPSRSHVEIHGRRPECSRGFAPLVWPASVLSYAWRSTEGDEVLGAHRALVQPFFVVPNFAEGNHVKVLLPDGFRYHAAWVFLVHLLG